MHPFARHALSISAALVVAACGGGSDDPTVTPAMAPTITTAPVASTVNAGGTVTFTVAATGSGTLSYQWRVDGVAIAGATSASYTTPALSAADSGKSYTVIVSNDAGSTPSTAAVLSVVDAEIAHSQSAADRLVATVNTGVAQLRQSQVLGGLLPFGAQTMVLPVGAVQTIPLAYCSTGSAGMSLTTSDSTGQPVSAQMSFSNCSYGFGGVSATVNGGATVTVTAWTNETNYAFRLAYDIAYSFTGPAGNESGTYAGQQTCTVVNDVDNCTTTVGSNEVSNVTVRTAGTVTTVDTGRINNSRIDCVYSGWVFDAGTGRATSGSVTVTAPNGDRAVITATDRKSVV